ncbi:hypothetical protein HMPREF1570_0737 [Klebsiella oxytoca KA-2]|nr:hypothetical protein HMPREF1570_0737 [Klebsiella oxytoca KA-2]EUC93701.1 hypothetical protein HMPREF1569_4175 [Klebsiella oxytoca OK-1]
MSRMTFIVFLIVADRERVKAKGFRYKSSMKLTRHRFAPPGYHFGV